MKLYAHPFSSYCQKVLIALWDNGTAFEYVKLDPDNPEAAAELEALWPLKRFPVLVDDGRTVIESSIIIEHLQRFHPGPVRMIPDAAAEALEVRFLDRFFDNYVSTPLQKIVFDSIRPPEDRDAFGVAEARRTLDAAYRWLDGHLAGRTWAAGGCFTLADCAAAPSLFYADWAQPIGQEFARVRDYRQRLLDYPSFARAVDEARPYRPLFPLGAPDRD